MIYTESGPPAVTYRREIRTQHGGRTMDRKNLKNCLSRLAAAALGLAAAVSLCAGTAPAYTLIQTEEAGSLTIEYKDGNTAFTGASFSLYRVADTDAYVRYTLTEAFEQSSVDLNSAADSSAWNALAGTLSAYAAANNIAAGQDGTTDDSGRLTFRELTAGLYLVVGGAVKKGNYTYSPTPFLVSLPGLNEEDAWEYDVTAEIKFEQKDNSSPSATQRKAVKVWKDGAGENRPESVTVQLLRNGMVYDEAVLSKDNNWSYTWPGLNDGDTWQLTEKSVPDGYTVSVSQSGAVFTVTNTYAPDIPGHPDVPDDLNDPGIPGDPGRPDVPNTPDTPDTPGEPGLPQTGQLNWPVPVLAVLGLVLFAAGWQLRFAKKRAHEK